MIPLVNQLCCNLDNDTKENIKVGTNSLKFIYKIALRWLQTAYE